MLNSAQVPVRKSSPRDLGALPTFPASWYLFGTSRDLERRPVVKVLLGRGIVAYRTRAGRAVVMDAKCAHFGANLGNGRVLDETIQCPYHGWRYGTSGLCVHIPAGGPIPGFARQRVYPVEERHRLLFFFN